MKKVILAFAVVSVTFAACNGGDSKTDATKDSTKPAVVDTMKPAVVDTTKAKAVVVDTAKKVEATKK